ncbi:MAG: T9SS type A sorting domain-containing protein [candidate division WOR-3 bacterium]
MKMIIIGLSIFSFLLNAQNEIFKAKLKGIQIDEYNPGYEIDSLTVYQSGEWVYMRAYSAAGFGDILATKLKETSLQTAKPAVGYFTGFTASSPGDGYIYLTATSDGGFNQDIIKVKWSGIGAQTFTAPSGQCISGFVKSGPDADGYVYLLVNTGFIGVEEEQKDREAGIYKFGFELRVIGPNPTREYTKIFYSIPNHSSVRLEVYDISGRLVKRLVDSFQNRGRYNLSWACVDENGEALPDGVYLVRLTNGKQVATEKLLLLK